MSNKVKAILSGLAVFLGGIVIAKVVFNTFALASMLGSFLVGAVVTAVLIARSRGERVKDVVEEVVQEVVNSDPDAPKKLVENQLTNLNQTLRLNCKSEKIIAEAENVIDLMLEVVPRAIDDSPNSAATFDLKKIATSYLADVVNDYLKLSAEDQNDQEASVLKDLTQLSEMVTQARDSLNEGNLDSFQISQAFLKEKTA